MEQRKQFTFYRSYWEAMENLPDADMTAVLKAVIKYALDEVEPDGLESVQKAFFLLVKPTLDSSRKKAANGRLGGKANGKQNASKKEAKHNQPDSEKEKENEREIEIENECYKRAYGEFNNVFLSNEEFEKVKSLFPADWSIRIEQLSGYIASTGKKYKSHYATLRQWARKDSNGKDITGRTFEENRFPGITRY